MRESPPAWLLAMNLSMLYMGVASSGLYRPLCWFSRATVFRQLLEILVDSDKINEPLSVTALYILLGTFVSHESKLESDC